VGLVLGAQPRDEGAVRFGVAGFGACGGLVVLRAQRSGQVPQGLRRVWLGVDLAAQARTAAARPVSAW
jgi:hypothetical protein